MSRDLGALYRGVFAQRAFVWLLSRVRSPVDDEVGLLVEALPAELASVVWNGA